MGSSTRSTSKPGKRESSSLRHRKIRASKTRKRAHPKREEALRKRSHGASEPEYKKVSRQVSTLGNHGAPNVTERAKQEAKTVNKRVSTPKTSERSIEKETAPTSDPEDQADNSIEGPRFCSYTIS